MMLGKLEHIMGFRERGRDHFGPILKDEHGKRVTATCDSNTGQIVGAQRE